MWSRRHARTRTTQGGEPVSGETLVERIHACSGPQLGEARLPCWWSSPGHSAKVRKTRLRQSRCDVVRVVVRNEVN
jgi:hypothetical protein